MPLEELMSKWKSGAPLSNGKKVGSQSQALAIAASEGHLGKKKGKAKKKKRREHPAVAAMLRNPPKP